jgi:hypothetical protein
MMTVKDLLTNTGVSSSPDGVHWEPAIPLPMFGWRYQWRDAWEVLNGRACAIRQTTKADLAQATSRAR